MDYLFLFFYWNPFIDQKTELFHNCWSEIPVAIKKNIKKFDAFIALGCVIKGKTPHFDLICKSSFEAIMNLSISSSKPIGNGIITAFNKKQAIDRSRKTNSKNKGLEAAKAVMSILKNGPKKI